MNARYQAPQIVKNLKSRRTGRLSYLWLIVGMALIGFLSQFQLLGSIIIGLFGIFALWRRIPSRSTFIAATLALSLVPVAILTGRWQVAQNFGSYSFLLLLVGLFCLTFELRREIISRSNIDNIKQ